MSPKSKRAKAKKNDLSIIWAAVGFAKILTEKSNIKLLFCCTAQSIQIIQDICLEYVSILYKKLENNL